MKIKGFFKTSFLTMILICLFVVCSFAFDSKDGVTTGQVNIRSGPGTSFSIVVSNLPSNTSVVVVDEVACSDGSTTKNWYKIEFKYNGVYYDNCYASTAYITVFNSSGISEDVPAVYKSYINSLKTAHPEWTFKFLYTGLSWDTVLQNENVSGISAIQVPPYNSIYRSTTDKTYNASTGTWTPIDGSTWFQASSDVVAYYLDPRNFLSSENTLFQFELLQYDNKIQNLSGVQQMLSGTFMDNVTINTGEEAGCDLDKNDVTDIGDAMVLFQYVNGSRTDLGDGNSIADLNSDGIVDVADAMKLFQYVNGKISSLNGTSKKTTYAEAFIDAAEQTGTSPYYFVSKVIQEVGTSGSEATSGTNSEYPGIYNFYNIGATSSANPVLKGLKWASSTSDNEQWNRPWDSQYKSIIGGAKYISNQYINVGQNTIYFQKFDVVETGGLYYHQYMTNIMGAYSEGIRIYNLYKKVNLLSSSFIFVIPVYDNMPSTAAGVKPTT